MRNAHAEPQHESPKTGSKKDAKDEFLGSVQGEGVLEIMPDGIRLPGDFAGLQTI